MRMRLARRRRILLVTAGVLVAGLLAACSTGSGPGRLGQSTGQPERVSGGPAGSYVVPPGIHKIKHVIIVMQENRSFDSYFGTYPGADGIPMKNGKPTGEYEDFLVGFVGDDRNVWGRPVGVAVTHDGSLLVSDDGSGSIWRVSYEGK